MEVETEEHGEDEFISRGYQDILSDQAYAANKILYLPTGSGKTFIAIMVLKRLFPLLEPPFSSGGKRAIFIVNTVALVEQQARVLERHLALDKVGQYSGDMNIDMWNKQTWNEQFIKFQVMVMTAEICHQLLLKKYVSLSNLAVIILDECHHATEDHPMRQIMRLFEDCPKDLQPRVIGLTATLLNSNPKSIARIADEVKKLEITLHSTVATVNSWDLVKQFSTNPREIFLVFEEFNDQALINHISNKINEAYDLAKNFVFMTERSAVGIKRIAGFIPLFSGKKNDVANLLLQISKQLVYLGPFGCSRAIEAVYVTLRILQQKMVDKKSHLMIHSFVCLLLSLSRYLDSRIGRGPFGESGRAFSCSSPKVKKLVTLIESHYQHCNRKPEKEREQMQVLVFVQEKMTAKVLCSVLKNIAKESSRFSFIKAEFIVGGTYNPLSETWEGSFKKYISDCVLERFRNKEINTVIATDILEEGIDIPNCNLVVRFDEANGFRSYVQSKGRARHSSSLFSIMIKINGLQEYENKIFHYKAIEMELERHLVGCTDDRMSPSEMELDDLYESELEPYYTPTGSKVTMTSAIQLVNGYCLFLAHDRFSTVSALWHRKTTREGKTVVAVLLPKLSPLQDPVEGEAMANLKYAKRAAALEVCKRLHQCGELDDFLLPNEKCLEESDLKVLLPLWQEEDHKTEPKTGTQKKLRTYPLQKPGCIIDCAPAARTSVFVHHLEITPAYEQPADPQKQVVFSLFEEKKNFAIISTKEFNSVCQFPVFSKFGALNVKMVNTGRICLTEEQVTDISLFHWDLFSTKIPLAKQFLVFSRDSYLIAPTRYNEKGCVELDWDSMKAWVSPPENVNSHLKCVISTVHRGVAAVHEEYIVTRVCRDLNGYSPFPNKSYSSYKDYFQKNHKFELINPDLPLLEVQAFQRVSNDLIPRMKVTEHTFTAPIHFPEEVCKIKCSEGCLFLKAVSLPSILHRLERLMLAAELRDRISTNLHLTTRAVSPANCCLWKQVPAFTKNIMQSHVMAGTKPKVSFSNKKNLPAKKNVQMKPWNECDEPVPVEHDFENVSLGDITKYSKFFKKKVSSELSNFKNAHQNIIKLPTVRDGAGAIKMLTAKGIGPHPCHILEALTAASSDDYCNLERLETLGDSFLKFAVSFMLYNKYPNLPEGKLTMVKGQILGNRNLFYCAESKQLAQFLKVHKVVPSDKWTPPSFSIPKQILCTNLMSMIRYLDLSKEEQYNNELKSGTVEAMITAADSTVLNELRPNNETISTGMRWDSSQQSMSDKAVADCVESLIGAYLETAGPDTAIQFMEWMKILPSGSKLLFQTASDKQNQFLRYSEFSGTSSKVAERIGYKFENESFLEEALTHASSVSSSKTYERLEFVGDAVLDFLVTAHIYESCEKLTPGQLTDLRSALVNNITFASLTVRYGLYKFLNSTSPALLDAMDSFVRFQEARHHVIDEEVLILLEENECHIADTVYVPKALGDLFEAIIGAVYLDCGRRLDIVWGVIYRLIKNEIDTFSQNVPKQVVRRLYETVGMNHVQFRLSNVPQSLNMDRVHVVLTVQIDGEEREFNGFGANKNQAKKSAAKAALNQIKVEM